MLALRFGVHEVVAYYIKLIDCIDSLKTSVVLIIVENTQQKKSVKSIIDSQLISQ